jgi:hypothetical protein
MGSPDLVAGIARLHNGLALLKEIPATGLKVPEMPGGVKGLFNLAGLWTPRGGGTAGSRGGFDCPRRRG